jgi:hypothetical protein
MNHKPSHHDTSSNTLTQLAADNPHEYLRRLWRTNSTLIHFVLTANALGFVVTTLWDPDTGMPTLVRFH